MKTGTMVEYAVRRTREHISNFLCLYGMVCSKTINEDFVSLLERHNNIFPEVDYKVYR
jgi:1,4-alpha-glucan branching enzyme